MKAIRLNNRKGVKTKCAKCGKLIGEREPVWVVWKKGNYFLYHKDCWRR